MGVRDRKFMKGVVLKARRETTFGSSWYAKVLYWGGK
jgi:hypothetical protein